MGIRRIFSVKGWTLWKEYWTSPQPASRRFVLFLVLVASIPYFGVLVPIVLIIYSLMNSLEYIQKGGQK